MKYSVGLLALCLALCQAGPAFEKGKKYIYEYEGRFGTGVSDQAVTQFSGKGLKGKLFVHYNGDELALQFSDLKSGDFNKRLPSAFDAAEIKYEDHDYLEKYERPFWGKYDNGRIEESKHHKDASFFEINGKRAVLGIFQTIFPEDVEHDHYYHVKEDGIAGRCNVSYIVNHHPYDRNPSAEVLNVTKNRLYDECSYRPHLFFSSMTGYKCKHCKEEDFQPLRSIGRVDYQISGNRKKYTIERAVSSGFISFSPFSTNGQTVHSITNVTLRLVEVKDSGDYPAVPGDAKTIHGLHFIFHDDEHDFDHEDLKENYNYLAASYDRTARMAAAEKHLPPLDIPFAEYTKLADYIHKLGYAFLAFDYKDFEAFFDKHVKGGDSATPAEKDRRNFLFKILPLVGTNPAIAFASHALKKYDVPVKVAMEAMKVMPFYAKTPSSVLVDKYYEFVKELGDGGDEVSSAGWLSWGTLIYKACVKDEFNPHPHHKETFIEKAKCDEYVKKLIKKFHDATKSEIKSVFVSAIKNTQTRTAFEFLINDVIPNHKYNDFIRENAIWGMEHFVPQYDEEVYHVLMPILTDVHEDYSLRIYAFDVLLYTDPSPIFFTNLVMCVNNEPNMQVASYVYSSLASFANTTDPCYESVAKHSRQVLPFFKNKYFDIIRYSTNKIYSFYNEKYAFGRTSQYIWLASNNSAFPREFYMRQAVNLGGYNFDFYEGGIVQRDNHQFDTILAMIFKQYNLIYRPKIDGEDYNLAKHFDHDGYTNKGMYEVYARLFNQEVFTSHAIDWKESPYITKISDTKFDIHFTKVISSAQMVYHVPNEMGLCTELYLHAPVVVKLTGTGEFRQLKSSETGPTEVEFFLQANYGFDIELVAGMEVHSIPHSGPYGYAVETNFGYKYPIHSTFDFNVDTREFSIHKKVSEMPYDILHYHTHPYTYTKRHDGEVPVSYSDKPVVHQYKFGHNYFGAGLKFHFEYDYYWNDYGSYRNFFKTFFHKSTRYEDYFDLMDKYYAGTRGFFDYALLNPTARPFELRVKFEKASTNPTNEVKFTWKRKESPYWDTETTEGYNSRSLDFEIHAIGPVERKWHFDVKVDRHWPVKDHKKMSFHFKRTALPNYDPKPYEICYDSEAKIHGYESIRKDYLKPEHDVKVDYHSTLKLGETCAGDGARQVEFKGLFKPSEEHTSLDKEKLPIYQKCKEDYQKGYEWSYACWMVVKDQGRLDNYVLDVEYSSNISPAVKGFFYRFWLWFRHTFYNNLKVDLTPNDDVAKNHVKLVVNTSYHHPIADVHVYRPHETVHYHNIYIPSVFPRYEPMTIMEPFWYRYLRKAFNFHKPMCFLSGDYVYTLDHVLYKYKLGKCYHVAVADCASEDTLVLYKHVEDPKYSKALKVVLGKHVVKVKPEGGSLVAYVDDKKVDDSKLGFFKKNEDDTLDFAVYKKVEGFVVNAKPYGLKIFFDGKNSKIMTSNLFRGRQCGMCGDFNSDKYHEFKSIDGTLHKDGSEFAHSYAIHKDDCHA